MIILYAAKLVHFTESIKQRVISLRRKMAPALSSFGIEIKE